MASSEDITYSVEVIVTANAKQLRIPITQDEVDRACGNTFKELVAEKMKINSMGMQEKLNELLHIRSPQMTAHTLNYRNSLTQSEMLKIASTPPSRRDKMKRSTVNYDSRVKDRNQQSDGLAASPSAAPATAMAAAKIRTSNSTGTESLKSLSLDGPHDTTVNVSAATTAAAQSIKQLQSQTSTTDTQTTSSSEGVKTETVAIQPSEQKGRKVGFATEPEKQEQKERKVGFSVEPEKQEQKGRKVGFAAEPEKQEQKERKVGFATEPEKQEQKERKVCFAAEPMEAVEKHEPSHLNSSGGASAVAPPKSCLKQESTSSETKALIREIVERLNRVLPKQLRVTNLGADIKSGLPLIVFIEKEFSKRIPAEALFTEPETADDMLANLTALFNFLTREHCLFKDFAPDKLLECNESSNAKFIDIILKHFSVKHSTDVSYSVSLGRRIEKIEHVSGIDLSESFVLGTRELPRKAAPTENDEFVIHSADPEKSRKVEKHVQKKRKDEEKRIKLQEEKRKRKGEQELKKKKSKQPETSTVSETTTVDLDSQPTQGGADDKLKQKAAPSSTSAEADDSVVSAHTASKDKHAVPTQSSDTATVLTKEQAPETEPDTKADKKKRKEEEKRKKEEEKKRRKEEEKKRKEEEKLKKKEKKKKEKEVKKQPHEDTVAAGTFKYAGDEEVVSTLNLDDIKYGDDDESSDSNDGSGAEKGESGEAPMASQAALEMEL